MIKNLQTTLTIVYRDAELKCVASTTHRTHSEFNETEFKFQEKPLISFAGLGGILHPPIVEKYANSLLAAATLDTIGSTLSQLYNSGDLVSLRHLKNMSPSLQELYHQFF